MCSAQKKKSKHIIYLLLSIILIAFPFLYQVLRDYVYQQKIQQLIPEPIWLYFIPLPFVCGICLPLHFFFSQHLQVQKHWKRLLLPCIMLVELLVFFILFSNKTTAYLYAVIFFLFFATESTLNLWQQNKGSKAIDLH